MGRDTAATEGLSVWDKRGGVGVSAGSTSMRMLEGLVEPSVGTCFGTGLRDLARTRGMLGFKSDPRTVPANPGWFGGITIPSMNVKEDI